MVYPTITAIKSLMEEISNPESNFEDLIFAISLIMAHSGLFLFPWTHWLELKNIENIFAKWKTFQVLIF